MNYALIALGIGLILVLVWMYLTRENRPELNDAQQKENE